MHFVDEEDHMTIAGLTNRGLKLYEDIQSNHQPIVYFSSAIRRYSLDTLCVALYCHSYEVIDEYDTVQGNT